MRQPPRSIARVLDPVLADAPDREALVTRSARLTYADLDGQAHRAAQALRSLGIGPGDRVAASLPNDADVVVAFHGAMRLGAVWLGINRALADPEKRYQLDDTGATAFLCEEGATVDGTNARMITRPEWQALVDAAEPEPVEHQVDPFAPAGIAYTSGTTGRPKGAVHSQRGLLVPGAVLVEARGYDRALRKGDCFPFTILNMAVLTTLLVSQAGGTSIVMDRIDAEGVAEWIRAEQVGTWNGPPALLHSLATMDEVDAADLASLTEVWTGGGDCPESIRTAFEAKFGVPVTCSYGLSEAPTVVSIDPLDGAHADAGSGRPLPHLDVQVLDDEGAPAPTGEPGEVCVGPAPGDDRYRLMLGYWERPDATAETLADGVLHTGDIGFLDDEGFLHLRDRKSLLIIRGGANVYPAEVERVLHAVEGIDAAAVLGVPDERLGERVVAVVEVAEGHRLDEEEVRAECLEQLARYKVPERLVVVDALPRNAMGKVIRTELPALLTP